MEAFKERLELNHEGRAWLAHTIEALHRTKRLPSLDTLTAKKRAPVRWEKQLEDLKAWVVATGGKVIVKSKDN